MINKKEDHRKKLIVGILEEKEIKNLAYRAIELASILNWELPEACDQIAGETISSVSWFLPNYEDYSFLYCIRLSEVIEEMAKKIIQNNETDF